MNQPPPCSSGSECSGHPQSPAPAPPQTRFSSVFTLRISRVSPADPPVSSQFRSLNIGHLSRACIDGASLLLNQDLEMRVQMWGD